VDDARNGDAFASTENAMRALFIGGTVDNSELDLDGSHSLRLRSTRQPLASGHCTLAHEWPEISSTGRRSPLQEYRRLSIGARVVFDGEQGSATDQVRIGRPFGTAPLNSMSETQILVATS